MPNGTAGPAAPDPMPQQLTLISQYAFYPMHWEAFRFLCTHYDVRGSVITPPLPDMPPLHKQLGWIGSEEARRESFHPDIRTMPADSRRRQRRWLHSQLAQLEPDAIWVQEEPTNRWLLEVLRYYQHDSRPQIACALAENIFRFRWWRRWLLARRWQRLNRILSVAQCSIAGIRRAGMPATVPAETLVAGAQAPPEPLRPMKLPLARTPESFVVGFAGRICPEKGWHVLLDAVERLPREFQIVLAGDGPQAELLRERLAGPSWAGRSLYLGPLPKAELWTLYKAMDCVATPHLTFPHWKEQFGGVLADAMAVGLPIIGSDSGSIPEVVGPAGVIVPEGDASRLAAAIRSLRDEPARAAEYSRAGRLRFESEFAIPAYSRKIATALHLSRWSHADGAAA